MRSVSTSGPANTRPEHFDAIVIGGGQAGLSVGHFLARHGVDFVILDAHSRVGDSWRARWDSLRLFTPARFDGLPGMPFPGPRNGFPTKDAMADYLEAYAAHFDLPVRSGQRAEHLARRDGRYCVRAGGRELTADHVVVAMANYQRPRVPRFAGELRPDLRQLHSADYRNPSQLQRGDVLIVGAGNSGSELAVELASQHRDQRARRPDRPARVWMAGRDTGHLPFRVDGLAGRLLLVNFVLRVAFHRILTVRTPLGRRLRPRVLSIGGPLIRVQPRDLEALGVERVPKVAGVEDGLPQLADGRVLNVANVIWCTGFAPGFEWIDLPVFGEDGRPRHRSGVAESEAGLYFVGLHFLHALSSAMIHGVGRDAKRIASTIATRVAASRDR